MTLQTQGGGGFLGQRVGFFGGTFDPPHRGHLAVAKAAADRFRLDQVLLAPVGVQPLKSEAPAVPYGARLEMTRLLCAGDTRLFASELDRPLPSGEPNYTVDALSRLREQLPGNAAVYVIVGADALLELRRWKDSARLLELADWIGVTRPGFALEELSHLELSLAERAKVHVIEDVQMPVSATDLRERLVRAEACDDWLTPAISEYIARHHLYSGERSRYHGV